MHENFLESDALTCHYHPPLPYDDRSQKSAPADSLNLPPSSRYLPGPYLPGPYLPTILARLHMLIAAVVPAPFLPQDLLDISVGESRRTGALSVATPQTD